MGNDKKINLIWQTDPDNLDVCVERDWILFLLETFPFKQYIDYKNGPGFSIVLPDSVIVVSDDGRNSDNIIKYAKKFDKFNKKPILWHLSDEAYKAKIDNYYPLFSTVIRNGHAYGAINGPAKYDIIQTPIGFITHNQNKSNKIKLASKRKFKWVFMGAIKNDRMEMIHKLKKKKPQKIVITKSFTKSISNFKQTNRLLQNTVFAPCPMGNSFQECSREYDALEKGCIPLLMNYKRSSNYHTKILGEHPIPIFNSWEEVAEFIDSYKKVDELQKEIFEWWTNYKNRLSYYIQNQINRTFLL